MASSPASLTSPAQSAQETDHILCVGVIHLEIRTRTIHFPDRRTIVMPSPRYELTETASVDSKIPHHELADLPLSKHSTFSLAFTLGSVSWSSVVVICWQSVTTTTVPTVAKWTWLRGDAASESDAAAAAVVVLADGTPTGKKARLHCLPARSSPASPSRAFAAEEKERAQRRHVLRSGGGDGDFARVNAA